jgi:hypothetical protein
MKIHSLNLPRSEALTYLKDAHENIKKKVPTLVSSEIVYANNKREKTRNRVPRSRTTANKTSKKKNDRELVKEHLANAATLLKSDLVSKVKIDNVLESLVKIDKSPLKAKAAATVQFCKMLQRLIDDIENPKDKVEGAPPEKELLQIRSDPAKYLGPMPTIEMLKIVGKPKKYIYAKVEISTILSTSDRDKVKKGREIKQPILDKCAELKNFAEECNKYGVGDKSMFENIIAAADDLSNCVKVPDYIDSAAYIGKVEKLEQALLKCEYLFCAKEQYNKIAFSTDFAVEAKNIGNDFPKMKSAPFKLLDEFNCRSAVNRPTLEYADADYMQTVRKFGLSTDEALAISIYTDSPYSLINTYLRGKEVFNSVKNYGENVRKDFGLWLTIKGLGITEWDDMPTELLNKLVQLVNSGLEKMSKGIQPGTELCRLSGKGGMDPLDVAIHDFFMLEQKVVKAIIDHQGMFSNLTARSINYLNLAFLSTSISEGNYGTGYELLYTITCEEGSPMGFVGPLSVNPSEKEVLLGANMKLTMVSVKRVETGKSNEDGPIYQHQYVVKASPITQADIDLVKREEGALLKRKEAKESIEKFRSKRFDRQITTRRQTMMIPANKAQEPVDQMDALDHQMEALIIQMDALEEKTVRLDEKTVLHHDQREAHVDQMEGLASSMEELANQMKVLNDETEPASKAM